MTKVVLFVLDGCRPDSFASACKPNIDSLKKNSLIAKRCVTVFPSSTGPAQASLLSGCYPEKTGLIGHFFWNRKNRRLVDINTDRCSEAENIFSILKRGGKKSLSIGPRVAWRGSEIGFRTKTMRKITESVASSQKIMESPLLFSVLQHLRESQRFMKIVKGSPRQFEKAFKDGGYDFYYFVLNDPDRAGHAYGPETQNYISAIERCDRQIGKVVDTASSCTEDVFFIITSDHGISTITKKLSLDEFGLDDVGYRVTEVRNHPVGKEIKIVSYNDGSAVATFVTRHMQMWLSRADDAARIVSKLRKNRNIGFVSDLRGQKELRILHERSPDVVFSLKPERGFDINQWLGDHGSLNKTDMEVPLIISGPGIKERNISSANIVDIAPTILKIFNKEIPNTMQGSSLLGR